MKKSAFILFVFYCLSNTLTTKSQILYDPVIEIVDQGFNFIEGPVWKDGVGLLFSDIPENKIYVWTPQSGSNEYLTPTGKSNGLAIDAEGNLILCQHFDRQVGKYIEGMGIEALATHYEGKRLNSPNDLAIKSDGSIFFTDPPFGLNDEGGTSELGYSGIYRLSPEGNLQLLDNTLNYPNGIAFSLDESKLYVTESDVADVYVWDVVDDTAIANKTLFYNIPGQWGDGMKTDEEGYLYVTGPVGVWILSPEGTLIQNIAVGTSASNCNWGPKEDPPTLYVTSNNTLFKITNRQEDPNALEMPDEKTVANPKLSMPRPNPFDTATLIPFYLDDDKTIHLSVIDMNGKDIVTLADGSYTNGWHDVSWNTNELGHGIYIIVLQTENTLVMQKCVK
ncbi:MAG: SMP-30/gluconolactonase/LRE family protein [Bacteroidales bacterium]|nr:SMP-30/gluconolactonase/LRE family protein [Bacteroidales bacterium]